MPSGEKSFKNIAGKRFGSLVAVRTTAKQRHGHTIRWLCHCDCGRDVVADGKCLRNGTTNHCGCLTGKRIAESRARHGHTRTGRHSNAWKAWAAAKTRCHAPSNAAYEYYGGRGIVMCDRWRENFLNFLADMGERPQNRSLDRIDNDGPYSPENCRWATRSQQVRNRRKAIRIKWRGETKTLPDWSDQLGLNYSMLKRRYQKGWSAERMFTQPKIYGRPKFVA